MRRAVVLRTAVTGAAVMSMTFVGGCSGGDANGQGSTPPSGSTSRSGSTSSAPASSATASSISASPTNSGIVPPSDASKAPVSGSGDEVAGAPGVPEPARHHTKDGAIAFAKHYVDVVNETGIHPKTGVLEPLALDGCKTCNNLEANIALLLKDHQIYSGPQMKTVKSFQMPGGDIRLVGVTVDQLAFDILGPGRRTFPALPRTGMVFTLDWTQGGWRVHEIQVDRSLT